MVSSLIPANQWAPRKSFLVRFQLSPVSRRHVSGCKRLFVGRLKMSTKYALWPVTVIIFKFYGYCETGFSTSLASSIGFLLAIKVSWHRTLKIGFISNSMSWACLSCCIHATTFPVKWRSQIPAVLDFLQDVAAFSLEAHLVFLPQLAVFIPSS